jgi:hypothetical protein
MNTTKVGMLGGVVLAMVMPALAGAQARLGVATTVVGPVTVTHVAASPAPLKFKDDVFLNDRVATGDQGFARMLLGGKAIITARERSVVTITEAPGVSTIDVVSGRISVAVDKSRMSPGELVEIKTPNAVSGIRGTIVVAEVAGNVSTITVLRGLVDVYRRDPTTGNAMGVATPLSARESVTVKDGVLPARPRPITIDQARRLSNEFTGPVRPVAPANTMVSDEVSRATSLMGALSGGTPGQTAVPSGTVSTTPATIGGVTKESLAAPTTVNAPASMAGPTLPTSPSTLPTLSSSAVPVVSSPLPTVSSPVPTVTSPLPAVSVPVPTVSAPVPTVSVPLPTLSTPPIVTPTPTVVPTPTVTPAPPTSPLPLVQKITQPVTNLLK